MKRKLVLTVLFILILTFGNLFSYERGEGIPNNGNSLLRGCRAHVKITDGETVSFTDGDYAFYWTGYLQGFVDSNNLLPAVVKTRKVFCIPDRVTVTQAARMVVQYIEQHPGELHNSPSLLIASALLPFTCRD